MSKPDNWPEDELPDDLEVLFIKPYTPEQQDEMMRAGLTDDAVRKAFEEANARDPDFRAFEDTITVYTMTFDLGCYMIEDDLALMFGDRDKLEKVYDALEDQYVCFYETVGNFLAYAAEEDSAVIIPEQKPVIH